PPTGRAFIVNPASATATELAWLSEFVAGAATSWSPDASRVLYGASLVGLEDGSLRIPFFDAQLAVSPRSTAASFRRRACPGKGGADSFAAVTLLNLTADLQAIRLPANNGILLRGTPADRDLDHYQLEYALQSSPDTWHPIGPASSVPVVDDVFAVFVPPDPGTYLLRLAVSDRAGSYRARTRVVVWDLRPALANLT